MISPTTPRSLSRLHHGAVALLSAFSLGLASPVSASEAHVHGLAQLQLAVEGNQVDLIFSSPAANVVGFEHRPTDPAQEKAVQDAAAFLEQNPLIAPGSGSCTLLEASANSELLKAGKDPDGDHHRHEEPHEHAEEHHAEHDEHEREAHTDFTVSQHLRCEGGLGNGATTPLLERFPAIQNLQVQWVLESSQGSTSLTREDNRINFAD